MTVDGMKMAINSQDKVAGVVLETKDYDKFKTLEGNRPLVEYRKQRIRKSINIHGLRFSPIIVNEKMEVIDGQGRYEVAKEDGLPIFYIVKPGMSLDDCIVLNSNTTAWTLQDYIDSYIAQGNQNYLALKLLLKKHPQAPIGAVMFAVRGISGGDNQVLKDGLLQIDEGIYAKADEKLEFAEKFLEKFQSGSKVNFLVAVMFCYQVEGMDRERLFNKWDKYALTKTISGPVVKIYDAIDMLERVYNFKTAAGNQMYLAAAYDKYCREKNAAYATRWSRMKEEA